MERLILASGSPGRKEVLEKAGIAFKVEVSGYDEDMSLNLTAPEVAKYLSKGKAKVVAAHHKNAIILAADSFALFNGQLFGKPHTTEKAREMLKTLSGQCHLFLTGFTIIDSKTGREYSDVVGTKVYFRHLSNQEINNYLLKENVLNNAGAYRIQNLGGALVEKIEGDYLNVIGLPLAKIVVALRDFGLDLI